MVKTLNISGVAVSQLESYQHAEDIIVHRIKDDIKTFCVAINPEKIYRSQKNIALRKIINSANLHICDGIGASLAAKILLGEKISRITGVQLFYNLMARAEKEGLKVFLLGASPDSNEQAHAKLKEMHPELNIVGSEDGYFEDDDEVIEMINNSKADMLFVAMGSPWQEKWLNQHRNAINAPYCMGVGGTLDVISGHAKWAPKIFRKTGTEFLYRLVTDPKRWRRQIVLPMFMLHVFKTKFMK